MAEFLTVFPDQRPASSPRERKVNPSEKVAANLFGHAGFVAGPLQKLLKIGGIADETLAAGQRLGTVKC